VEGAVEGAAQDSGGAEDGAADDAGAGAEALHEPAD